MAGNYFHNVTGLNDYDNYMNTNAPASFGYYAPYLNQPAVRYALHVGNASFPSAPSTCERHLLGDFMVSLVEELVALLDSTAPHYKVNRVWPTRATGACRRRFDRRVTATV